MSILEPHDVIIWPVWAIVIWFHIIIYSMYNVFKDQNKFLKFEFECNWLHLGEGGQSILIACCAWDYFLKMKNNCFCFSVMFVRGAKGVRHQTKSVTFKNSKNFGGRPSVVIMISFLRHNAYHLISECTKLPNDAKVTSTWISFETLKILYTLGC